MRVAESSPKPGEVPKMQCIHQDGTPPQSSRSAAEEQAGLKRDVAKQIFSKDSLRGRRKPSCVPKTRALTAKYGDVRADHDRAPRA